MSRGLGDHNKTNVRLTLVLISSSVLRSDYNIHSSPFEAYQNKSIYVVSMISKLIYHYRVLYDPCLSILY